MITTSIIIPTYNRQDLLRQVLDTLAKQHFALDQLEVVVIVDASTDGTWEMLQQMRQPYTLRPVWQDKKGVAAARNLGAQVASGHILIFIDDDIIPVPDFIAEHMQSHQAHPNSVVIGRISADKTMPRGGWMRFDERMIEKKYKNIETRDFGLGRCLYSGNFSVPRAAFLAVNGFDTTLRRAEDIDLGFRLHQRGLGFAFNGKADGLHYGYRDFKPWLAIQYQYGKLDVELYRDRGYDKGLATVFGWYHTSRHALNRWIVQYCIMHSGQRGAIIQLLHGIALILDTLRLWSISYYSYSAMVNIEYWRGVVEALGGIDIFNRYIEQYRPDYQQLQKVSS